MVMKSVEYCNAIKEFNNDIDNPIIYCVVGNREALQKLAEDCPDLNIQYFENANEVPVGNVVTILPFSTFWIVTPPSGESYKVVFEKVEPRIEFSITFKHLGVLLAGVGCILLLRRLRRK